MPAKSKQKCLKRIRTVARRNEYGGSDDKDITESPAAATPTRGTATAATTTMSTTTTSTTTMNAASDDDDKNHVNLGGGDDDHGEDERLPARGQPIGRGINHVGFSGGDGHGGNERGEKAQTTKDDSCKDNSTKNTINPNTVQNLNLNPVALLSNKIKPELATPKSPKSTPFVALCKSAKIAPKWRRKLENRAARKIKKRDHAIFDAF